MVSSRSATDPTASTSDGLARFGLRGRTALVVGIGPAIGQAVARTLAAAGARVVLTARSTDRVADLVRSIQDSGMQAEGHVGDITNMADRTALLEAAGSVDILFYNAYAIDAGEVPTFELASLLEASDADWDACFRTNMLAPFQLARSLVPAMIERGHGSVIHCTAAAAFTPILPAVAYGATKAGLAMMTTYLARACGPQVRVNAIAPSNIEVPDRPEALRTAPIHFPMRRMGLPEDVADAALYLASDASRFVTGQVIHVDGGRVTTA